MFSEVLRKAYSAILRIFQTFKALKIVDNHFQADMHNKVGCLIISGVKHTHMVDIQSHSWSYLYKDCMQHTV